MNFPAKVLLSLVSVILFSCDPAKVLILEAPKKPDFSVTVYANNNILPKSKEDPNKKIVVGVPYTDSVKHYKKVFYYGLGGWNESMGDFAANVDSIIINRGQERTVLKSKAEIKSYLEKNRQGWAKQTLKISAK